MSVPAGCPLSVAEFGVVRGAAEGKSTRQIGRELGVSPSTVRTHYWKAAKTLGVKGRAALAVVFLSAGWLDPVLAFSDGRVSAGQRLYLEAFDRMLAGRRESDRRERGRLEMRYMLGAMHIERGLGHGPPARDRPPPNMRLDRELDRTVLP